MQNRPRRSYRRQPNARTRHDRFEPVIRAASDSAILADPTLGGQLVIEREGRLTVSYAPFEHIQRGARIVIVGITPGAQQAGNAPRELRRQLLAGADHSTALAAAKVYASFSGAMRPNLVGMLDHIGVARWLGIRSTDSLWSADRNQVHFTSAFRYPVFYDGANNFNGQVAARRSKALTRVLNTCLAEEAAALDHVPTRGVAALPRPALSRAGCRYQAATADRLIVGSSLTGASVSSVM